MGCLALAHGPTLAQEPYPASFLRHASGYRGVPVNGYRITGIDRSLGSDLAGGLALQGKRRLLRRTRPVLSPSSLKADLDRVVLFLARHGYPTPRLNPRIDPAPNGRHVTIVLEIDPGAPVRIGDVRLEGFPTGDPFSLDLDVGARVIDARIDTEAHVLREGLRSRGYAFAAVRPVLEPMDSLRVRVRFVAVPGPRCHWGGVIVDGTSPDLSCLVRRVAPLPQGAPFSPRTVRRIEERLRMLDLFRRVQLEPVARPDTSGVVDLLVRLADLDPRRVEAGLGMRTDEGFLARAGWMHRNLLGGGRGVVAGVRYGSHTRSLTAMLWFPGLLGADLRQEAKVEALWQREEGSRLEKYEVELGTRYHRSLRLTAQAGIRERLASYRQIASDGTITSATNEVASLVFVALRFDGADDRLDPRRGWMVSVDGRRTIPGLRSDVGYGVAHAAVSLYRPMGGTVVASRIALGRAWSLEGTTELPPDARFYAGGSASMRGFTRRKLGPLDAEGNPLGGEALLEAGVELRVPLVRPVLVAAFVDAGQVWRTATRARFDEIEVALGAGARVRTPVGHVRLDVARRLTEIVPGQPASAYHLALGHAF